VPGCAAPAGLLPTAQLHGYGANVKWPLALLIVLGAGAAHAAGLPQYEPEQWCHTVASAGGTYSQIVMNGCIIQEQQAYDTLKERWATEPARARAWCDTVATSGGQGSYIVLLGCLVQEDEARESQPTFRR